ncbi:MAG: NYN domain-containing protein [Kiritimatiellae bacterium]|nr:NYN domain-containing protein [Kiritimatiellia bacterium]
MQFNTAILYDIENLMGGYGKADMLSSLSLKDIHNEIQKKEIGKIAIQRAYANWSDPRLNILRGDIIELGIEPIQMFGFGRGPQKNASDIQLAIDAIDIAFTRKAVNIFIIVSGDGGFSALAKKLHEYGCMVIGCAYRRTTNRVFEAVCDDFVWIDEPKDEYVAIQKQGSSEFNDPILVIFSKQFKPAVLKPEDIFKESVEILNHLAKNNEALRLLKSVGVNISIFSQALSYRIKNFNFYSLGFARFVDFIRYVSNQSKLKLVHNPPSEYRLLLNDFSIKDFVDVEPITRPPEIHSLENYTLLLSKGQPIFRLSSREIILSVSHHLAENKIEFQSMLIGDILDRLEVNLDYEQSDIKGCLFSFVSAGCFMKEPEDGKLSEQKLSFIPQSSEQSVNMLREAMFNKLQELLGKVDDSVFTEIIS